MLRSAAGLAEAAARVAALAGTAARDDRHPAPGRPPTCSPSAPASAPPPRCARRPAARTGARTSPSATTRAGPATSTYASDPDGLDLAFTPGAGQRRRPGRGRRGMSGTAGIAATPYAELPAPLVEELVAAGLEPEAVYAAVVTALAEDLPDDRGDVTSAATIAAEARGSAVFAAREDGRRRRAGPRRAGLRLRPGRARSSSPTGSPTAPGSTAGDVVMRVEGPVRGLLCAERTALNFASHLSGVATATVALGRRARGHLRPGARHPQDPARLARPAEVRRALRRGRQPPVQPVRHGDGQGQPRDRRRRRGAGLRGGADAVPGRARRGRGHRPRPAARAARGRLRPDPARQHGHRHHGRGGPGHRGPRQPRGLRRPHPRPGPRGRGDRRRLHLGRRAHPLGGGLRPRHGPRGGE